MAQLRYIPNVVTLQLDQSKCTGCGMCAEVCPHGVFALEFGDRQRRVWAEDSELGTDAEISALASAPSPCNESIGAVGVHQARARPISVSVPNSDRTARIVDLDACMECGACARNCPAEAISVRAGVGCAVAVMNAARRKGEPGCGCSEQSGCCN